MSDFPDDDFPSDAWGEIDAAYKEVEHHLSQSSHSQTVETVSPAVPSSTPKFDVKEALTALKTSKFG